MQGSSQDGTKSLCLDLGLYWANASYFRKPLANAYVLQNNYHKDLLQGFSPREFSYTSLFSFQWLLKVPCTQVNKHSTRERKIELILVIHLINGFAVSLTKRK